jgi:alpha-galactosidase
MLAAVLSQSTRLADTPPMGWNSYDCFSYAVTEQQVKQNADYMAKHLKRFGWDYVVVDYVWSAPKGNPNFAPDQSPTFQPSLAMDAYGRLQPDPDRFPSSALRAGFKPLADYCHSKGLKFGIHLMRGIPRQAVSLKTVVLGTGWTAEDAANQNSKCPWLNHMFGLNMDRPAGQAYLNSLFKQYAEWGIDFVKVDDLSNPYSKAEVEGYRVAIQRCNRPIVLSLSPGPTPVAEGAHVSLFANMWRLVGDLWDNWPELKNAMDVVAKWSAFRKPGHWPDIDMLPLGKLREFGPNTGPPNTQSRFTPDEARTLMTLMCINQNPLMFGGNLPDTDAPTLKLISNADVLAVDQTGVGGHLDNETAGVGEWQAGAGKDGIFVAFINRNDAAATVTLPKAKHIHDLWEHHELKSESSVSLPPHGSVLLRVEI